MTVSAKELVIWMNGSKVGIWRVSTHGADILEYSDDWFATPVHSPLSQSLPLTLPGTSIRSISVNNYFDNLLPDSIEIRKRVASRYQLHDASTFNLLSAIGRDCVGAIQLLPHGETPSGWDRIDAVEMSDKQVQEHLRNVTSTSPLMTSDDVAAEDLRISIAGAQEKSGLLELNGKWWMPRGATPTNRILKLPLGSIGGGQIPLHDSIANEWLCSQILAGYGLPMAFCEMKYFAQTQALSVHRFDRQEVLTDADPVIYRLPQEDFCQALGLPPHIKYEAEGGPGFVAIATALKRSLNAEQDIATLFEAQVLFWMLLGIDGHAKNFSIRLLPEGRFHLAPLYDVISMWPYAGHGAGKASLHKLKMAMSVMGESGKHYVWSKIQRRHFEHMGKMVGIPDPAGIIDQVVARTPGVVRGVLAQLPADFPETISQAILSGLVESALKLGRAPSST
ncbi:type II toxin-antitoxin system HipA family toxin [Diaphorobacter sp. HDW4B]|uniref:type II toxin-antitoxin system HipA family toxin n=1 Tax=Diaphorobacter sp. HDW4B TaxID=2714925 RepID=UPI001409007F|nr:type II toxin-antitoxin system HipA family toxin [Diaphorobacter sp. HDW4B]QIL70786.1 type II toxin-antitoxin system HipA family toxin [Diaphorobacter sp. HDW4B]